MTVLTIPGIGELRTGTGGILVPVVQPPNASSTVTTPGNPVANPGADGYAPGIYFPDAFSLLYNQPSTPVALARGFARLETGGPQVWSVDTAGLYFVGSQLYAGGSFNFLRASGSSFPMTITVTDGQTTKTKVVTVTMADRCVYFGTNVLLDTASTSYYGKNINDPLNHFAGSPPGLQGNYNGGTALALIEPSGKLQIEDHYSSGNGGWIANTEASYPMIQHCGAITDATLHVTGNGQDYTVPLPFWIAQEQPAGLRVDTPAPIYDYFLPGDVLFQLAASSDAGIAGYSLISCPDPVQISATGSVVVTAPLTAGANKSIRLRVTSNNGKTTDITHAYSVTAGTVLPATNITMTVAQNLDNQVLYQVVGTPAVTGMGSGLKWRIIQKEAHKAIFSDTILTQFTCDTTTGKVQSTYMLPARAQGHTFTLVACDGPNVCRQTFTVPCAWWNGPTVYVGRGMHAAHGDGVGYDHFSDLLPRLNNQNSWPDRTNGVATIIWAADSDPNYYANDNCNGRGAFPADFNTRYGIQGSVRMIAADLNGPRVRIGGQIGSPNGGGDMNGKGFINKGPGDLYMEGFEVSWVLGDDPYHGISGIRYNADIYGDCTLVDCYTHDCDNGVEAGCEVGILTIDRCYSTNCGANYVSSGATHGYYLEGVEVIVKNTHSYKHTNGHCLKIRAANYTITGCTLGDGARGTCSQALNLPEGGSGVVSNNDFHKGPNAQNPACIGFAEDDAPEQFDHRNVLTLKNNRFSIMQVGGSRGGNGVGVLYFPRISTVDGSKMQVLMDGNQFYLQGSAVKSQVQPTGLTDPNFIPATDTNSTILTAAPLFSFTDPRVDTGKTPGARPGFFVSTYDNETNYANMNQTQFDCGTEDLRFSASTAAGTPLATITASGALIFAIQNANDIRLNPFVSGTTWAITQDSEYFPGAVWPPVGAFTLNTASGGTSTQLVLGTGNSAGTQILKLRATAPNGTVSDWRYAVTLTA